MWGSLLPQLLWAWRSLWETTRCSTCMMRLARCVTRALIVRKRMCCLISSVLPYVRLSVVQISWVAVAAFGQTKQAWLAQFLDLPNGIPSHDTFGRVFAALDAEQFQQGFVRWVRAIWPVHAGEVIALDGKTVRGSHDRTIGKDAIHMVSAWANHARLTLAQCVVDTKSNEITALPELLRLLHLQGSTVTIDAMGCQTAIARQIVEQKADYVLALKENHEQLYADVVDTFAYVAADGWQGVAHDYDRTVESGHGRIEQREYWLIHEQEYLAFLNPKGRWHKLGAIGRVVSQRSRGTSTTSETRYYLLSGRPSAQRFAHAVRGHWGIETSVHWVLDVVFGEDASRVRKGYAPANFTLLRQLALNLLRHAPSQGSIATKRFRAALDDQYLLKVLQP